VCEAIIRISPQNQPTKNDDGSFNVTFVLSPAGYKFEATHHIMLQIASGAHPHWTRNPGTGEHISTATEFISSTQVIWMSSTHLSSISLPVML